MNAAAHHETFVHQGRAQHASDRQFGIVIAVFLLAAGMWPLRHGGNVRLWALIAGLVLLAAACVRPSLLHQPNRLWTAFGMLLGKITSPLVTGLLFFGVFTPAAFVMRLAGKDPLRLRPEPGAASYWIDRTPPETGGASMTNQF